MTKKIVENILKEKTEGRIGENWSCYVLAVSAQAKSSPGHARPLLAEVEKQLHMYICLSFLLLTHMTKMTTRTSGDVFKWVCSDM